MKIAIRPARLTDAPAMGRTIVESYLVAHKGQVPEEAWNKRLTEWTPEVSARAWERSVRSIAEDPRSGECVLVAEDDLGRIVGVGMAILEDGPADDEIGEVNVLYVLPAAQGHGVGRALLGSLVAHLADFSVSKIQIAVLKTNAPARRFYEAMGGKLIGEREFDEEGVLLTQAVYQWDNAAAIWPKG